MIIKTTGDVVHGLKAQPILLCVVVINVVVMGAWTYFLVKFSEANAVRTTMILERCLPARTLVP